MTSHAMQDAVQWVGWIVVGFCFGVGFQLAALAIAKIGGLFAKKKAA